MSYQRSSEVETGSEVLGLASIGIGLTELVAPAYVERLLGLDHSPRQRGILQVLGVRELMHGVGILTGTNRTEVSSGVWARVAGDVLDTALLGMAAAKTKRPGSFAAVAAAVAAIGIADMYFAGKASGNHHSRY
jgi:hypothetical protein